MQLDRDINDRDYCKSGLTSTCHFTGSVGAWVLNRSRDCGSRGKTFLLLSRSSCSCVYCLTFGGNIAQPCCQFLSSHKSSSIQKETPKKKPKLEMKPSNGDRYERCCNSWLFHLYSAPIFTQIGAGLMPLFFLPSVVPSPSQWTLEERTTSFSSVSWKRRWCLWRDFCSKGIRRF